MATTSKMRVNGLEYDIIDAEARERIAAVETDLTDIREDISDLQTATEDLPAIREDLNGVHNAITGLSGDITGLQTATADLPDIRSDVSDLKTVTADLPDIRSDVSDLKTATADIRGNVNTMKDNLDRIGEDVSLPFGTSDLVLGDAIVIGTGANTNSNYSCRSNAYLPIEGTTKIELDDARYVFDVWRYSTRAYTSMVDALKAQYDEAPVILSDADGAAFFRLAVQKVDKTEFTSSDAVNVVAGMKWYKVIDNTVSIKNAAAEAYTVGQIFEQYNAIKVSPDMVISSEKVLNGITYSVDSNGVASFDGTATSSFAYNVLGTNYDSIPSWIHENTRYYIKMNKNNDDPLRVRVVLYDSNYATIRNAYDSSNDGYFIIPSFEGVAGIAVRYFVKQGATVDCTSRLVITNAFSNIELSEKQPEAKVRLMQYNMGRWNMGAAVDSTTEQYLRQDNYLSIMANMRQMFGEYQPDVIGAEEFEMERDVYTSDGSSVYTHINFGTEVYNRLYPNILYDMGNVASRLALMSKYNIMSGGRKQINYTYTYNGETKSGTGYVRICHVNIANKNVCFAVTAMVQSSGDEPMEEGIYKRQVFIPLVLDLLDGEEYAFVISDVNNGGVERTFDNVSSSAAEGTAIHNNILVPNGFNSVHGDYFPWQMTYYGRNIHSMAAIDNIFYKDNGKIVFCGFKVLDEYYNTEENKLISDHTPVIADFILL